MSRPITINEEVLRQCMEEFAKTIRGSKLPDGKISFSRTLTGSKDRAKVIFSPGAFAKMLNLIFEFSDEVAWHGTVHRVGEPSDATYYVDDILVYPQEVTGATVNTDQERYQNWLMAQPDEIFNSIRLQGHSHVRMAVSPSGTDLTHQERLLDQLDNDMFYIFTIWNKELKRTFKVYDMAINTFFSDEDIDISVDNCGISMSEFLSEAKELVVRKTYTGGNNYSGNSYGVYSKNYYGSNVGNQQQKPATPTSPAPVRTYPQSSFSSASSPEWAHTAYGYDCYDN